jgi:hypothetical protein
MQCFDFFQIEKWHEQEFCKQLYFAPQKRKPHKLSMKLSVPLCSTVQNGEARHSNQMASFKANHIQIRDLFILL